MHVFPDLKRLERKYAQELTVVGIHSAKFTNEQGTENIRKAAQRLGLEHPIANDNNFTIWRDYGVHAWPTIVILDPEGNYLDRVSGEGHYEALDRYLGQIIKIFDSRHQIDRKKVIGKAETPESGVLSFPEKICADGGRLFVADTGHNRILILDERGGVSDVIGSGKEGSANGAFATAEFNRPHGVAAHGEALYVADTENHVIRAVDLRAKTVEVIAGTGQQHWATAGGPARAIPLNSPWDVLVSPDGKTLYIAMAGDHRIWSLDLQKKAISILAGDGHEDVVDGTFAYSSFAQPSGLALDGDTLYVADSEGSAIRALDLKAHTVETVIGYSGRFENRLFTFGDVDGPLGKAKLQHDLAVVTCDGELLVADTYNHKIKRVDPIRKTARTLFGDGSPGRQDGKQPRFNEPGGLALLGGKLYIADTNNHAIRVADLTTKAVTTVPVRIGQ